MWVRRTALRLPDAADPWHGTVACAKAVAQGEPFRLLLVGESTVAGVGVERQADALSGQLAVQLAVRLSRTVCWQACGRNGATAAETLAASLEMPDARWDAVVIVLGVNDTTHLTPRWRWRRSIRELVRRFSCCSEQVLLTAVPPLGSFTALPQPLRAWLGLRAGLLDRDLRTIAQAQAAVHVPFAAVFAPHMLARDGYHPSAEGYRAWAAGVADRVAPDGQDV
ncbi:SGNH/GDSL hydrolase family protein [Halopseudomonas nanhaiensis]|uniref:SGNH/GDSL hydrolase family protein n=1 Tax=Halopseudomonas nanhaiensis TaxID=2830842 RepID=UPI001CBDA2A0|nr:SGNH/GDSL hydrolase family protein [Halopseudomonas nanhaiensis]UAW97787.1 SGNH/GDSL hydrolase family protein [Halopseudomonas nanhaiensis]